MPISEKTILEMRVGAENVARWERMRTLDILKKRKIVRHDDCSTVWVGDTMFVDTIDSGWWPSQLLMARVALAIEGGLHLEKE